MIAWTIEAARESKIFDKIVVSTDSEEIADVSRKWGAEVPFLREDKADDISPVSEATITTLKQLEKSGMVYNTVVQLFAVCPLRNSGDIVEAYRFFMEKQCPSLISCYKFSWMNPWWAIQLDDNNRASWIFKDTFKRSQDLPELYCPTGAIWIANVQDLFAENTFYMKDHIFWELEWTRAIDIDNYNEIKLAKALSSIV